MIIMLLVFVGVSLIYTIYRIIRYLVRLFKKKDAPMKNREGLRL